MFILRSTHEKLIQAEREHRNGVVAQLLEQITDLRKLVFIEAPTRDQEHPIRAANAILDGQEVMPTVDPEQEAQDLAEANRILSGQYDRFEDSW